MTLSPETPARRKDTTMAIVSFISAGIPTLILALALFDLSLDNQE